MLPPQLHNAHNLPSLKILSKFDLKDKDNDKDKDLKGKDNDKDRDLKDKDKARPHQGSTMHTIFLVWRSFQNLIQKIKITKKIKI